MNLYTPQFSLPKRAQAAEPHSTHSLKSYRSHAALAPELSSPSIESSRPRTRTTSSGPLRRSERGTRRPGLFANVFLFIEHVTDGTTHDLPLAICAGQQQSTVIVGRSVYSTAYSVWVSNHIHDKLTRFYHEHPSNNGYVCDAFCYFETAAD
jgi:hypothetical protein